VYASWVVTCEYISLSLWPILLDHACAACVGIARFQKESTRADATLGGTDQCQQPKRKRHRPNLTATATTSDEATLTLYLTLGPTPHYHSNNHILVHILSHWQNN
jgi:hypothetical protein